MIEPFLPHPERDDQIAAADPGVGAPAPAPGFGIEGEDPDVAQGHDETGDASTEAGATTAFRTPDPDDVGRHAGS